MLGPTTLTLNSRDLLVRRWIALDLDETGDKVLSACTEPFGMTRLNEWAATLELNERHGGDVNWIV